MATSLAEKLSEEIRSLNTELFLYKTRNTECFSFIQDLMRQYKADRCRPNALILFEKLVRFIKKTESKDLIDEFNKCLVKEALIPKTQPLKEKCVELLAKEENPIPILQKVSSYFQPPKPIEVPQPPPPPQQLDESMFLARLKAKPLYDNIVKIAELYLQCVITIAELRSLMAPYMSRAELAYFIESAQVIEVPRRKGTSFVPLNQMPQTSFVQRMNVSYVEMPECYAKKCNDSLLSQDLKGVLNRKWVSVPLGSEHVSFSIMRKNCYEDELFKNQDQKYELDHTIIALRRCVQKLTMLEKQGKFVKPQPLIKKIVNQIYGTDEPYQLMMKKVQAIAIVKPRIEEKLKTLERSRQKAIKQWQDLMTKNFHKSLDHRSFYFRKNQKKYNCTSRWDRELDFRQSLYGLKNIDELELKDGKQRFNDQICQTVDSFQNITKQRYIVPRQILLQFPPIASTFPQHPANKTLFVMHFGQRDVLLDVACVLNQYISKKSLLQYLYLKMFNLNIKKVIEINAKNVPAINILRRFDGLKPEEKNDEFEYYVDKKRKNNDSAQEFQDLIEQEMPAINLMDVQSPFQGPSNGHNFFGIKQHYYFLRYLLTLYQRFLIGKTIAFQNEDSRSQSHLSPTQKYEVFKAILMHKLKDPKLQEYLRKVYCKNAYIFLSMDKLIVNAAKIVNGCDDLAANIIKYDTKDYEHEIKPLDSFKPKSDYHQMLRLYHENQVQFRFSFLNQIMYVSAWESAYRQWINSELLNVCQTRIPQWMALEGNGKQQIVKMKGCEYISFPNHILLQPTEEEWISKRRKVQPKQAFEVELKRRLTI